MSDMDMDRMCIHPKYTQANIINKKKLNTAVKIITAKVAVINTNKFSIV